MVPGRPFEDFSCENTSQYSSNRILYENSFEIHPQTIKENHPLERKTERSYKANETKPNHARPLRLVFLTHQLNVRRRQKKTTSMKTQKLCLCVVLRFKPNPLLPRFLFTFFRIFVCANSRLQLLFFLLE